jgi:archaellum biogenesis ATPase FlaH
MKREVQPDGSIDVLDDNGIFISTSVPDDVWESWKYKPTPNGNGALAPSGSLGNQRYSGRRVDGAELLSRPPRPIPWRVHDIVADGTLTIVSGESGTGKSWLAQALCSGVANGRATAGLLCSKGIALYVDGEMGAEMFIDQRLRPTGASSSEFELIDAMGLDISTPGDVAWLRTQIEEIGANLVVIDSLRRLAPSKAENDSDDMAPTISALAKLARDTHAAILLVHHKGDGEKFWRGSTAIRDQADALFGLMRDDEDGDVRRLSCGKGKGKMRYAPEPADRFMVIDPEAGGVAGCDRPDAGPVVPVRQSVAAQIKAALPGQYKKEVAEKIGRNGRDQTFRDAWADLERTGEIVQVSGQWVSGSSALTLGAETTTTAPVSAATCKCDRPLATPDDDGDLRCARCKGTVEGWPS